MGDKQTGLEMWVVYWITFAIIICIAVCSAIESNTPRKTVRTMAMFERYMIEERLESEELVGPLKPLSMYKKLIPAVEVEVVEPEPVVEVEPIVEKAVEEIKLPEIGSLAGDPAIYLAKTVWGEARGCSPTEQAAVVWCVLNRVDSELAYMPDDIISVITQIDGHGYYHFRGYNPDFPVTDEIYDIVVDVLARWELEKTGVENVGRVLPKEYLYFHGDNVHNYFRDEYTGGNRWDWSLESPYE